MSHDDRIRRAFDDVAAQAGAIEPPQMGEIAEQVAVTRIATRRGWLPAVAAAAVIVVAVGAVVLLDGGGDEGVPPGSQTDSTVNTSIPGVTAATSATVGSKLIRQLTPHWRRRPAPRPAWHRTRLPPSQCPSTPARAGGSLELPAMMC